MEYQKMTFKLSQGHSTIARIYKFCPKNFEADFASHTGKNPIQTHDSFTKLFLTISNQKKDMYVQIERDLTYFRDIGICRCMDLVQTHKYSLSIMGPDYF